MFSHNKIGITWIYLSQGMATTKASAINFISKKYKNLFRHKLLVINNLISQQLSVSSRNYNFVTLFLQFGYTMKHVCTWAFLYCGRFY